LNDKSYYLDKFFNLENEVILITGGLGKLGRKYAETFSAFGAEVVLVDIVDPASVEFKLPLRTYYFKCDIANKNDVRALFSKIKLEIGLASVLINNAAAAQTTFFEGSLVKFEDFPLEVWQANLNVNLTGAFLCSQEAGKHMLELGRGNIVNISSTYGIVACDQRIYGTSGLNSNVAYATTKSGLVNFTRYLASYWQGKGIRVNCLVPGGVYNNQPKEFFDNYISRTMLKRMAEPDDLGAALLYLISNSSSWVTGSVFVVDGGFSAW